MLIPDQVMFLPQGKVDFPYNNSTDVYLYVACDTTFLFYSSAWFMRFVVTFN